MPPTSRRHFVAGIAAGALAATGLPAPLRAAGFEDVIEAARAIEQLRTIIVSVDGREVAAAGFRGGALDRPANVKSVSKTLLATLTGAAIEAGILSGTDERVLPHLARWRPSRLDPRAEAITVEHLLTMRSGLARTSGAAYGAWVSSRDWVGYVLRQPMHSSPGQRFGYSTGDWHLLAAVLTEASGRSLLDLARERLGRPLGIDIPAWTRDPHGIYMGGNNMALSPRAMVVFGEAMRQGGSPIVSRAWIDASWRPRTRSPFSGHDYGYGWFLARMAGEDVAYARGYGGQVIYVVPGARLTVAITSDPTRPARSGGHMGALHDLLAGAIIPAARRA
jgi:CubicO group peptidase (beta-lactamase class C family)